MRSESDEETDTRLDALCREAVRVPVPAGLAGRICTRVAERSARGAGASPIQVLSIGRGLRAAALAAAAALLLAASWRADLGLAGIGLPGAALAIADEASLGLPFDVLSGATGAASALVSSLSDGVAAPDAPSGTTSIVTALLAGLGLLGAGLVPGRRA